MMLRLLVSQQYCSKCHSKTKRCRCRDAGATGTTYASESTLRAGRVVAVQELIRAGELDWLAMGEVHGFEPAELRQAVDEFVQHAHQGWVPDRRGEYLVAAVSGDVWL